MSKFHRSNESKKLSLQSTSDVVSSIAKRLALTQKHKVQRSHNPDPMKKTKPSRVPQVPWHKSLLSSHQWKQHKMKPLQKLSCKRNTSNPKGAPQLSQQKSMVKSWHWANSMHTQLIGLIPELQRWKSWSIKRPIMLNKPRKVYELPWEQKLNPE